MSGQTVQPPFIQTVLGGGSVELGQRVTLVPSFSSGGVAPGTQLQWSKDGSILTGQTTSNLVVAAAAPTDAGNYSITATNSAGSSTSFTVVVVKAAAAPAITAPPRTVVIFAGQSALFTVGATGSYPRNYQWRRDGTAIAGETADTYLIRGATPAEAGQYSVEIANAYGSVASATAGLVVSPARLPVPADFPPEGIQVVQGQAASIVASVANGTSPYSYQWMKDGQVMPGATQPSLSLDGAVAADAGRYAVTISNFAGSATSGAVEVTVTPAAVPFRVKVRNQPLRVGYSLELQDTDSLFEKQPTTYQWYKDGKAIPQATASSYSARELTTQSAGAYFVVTTTVAGTTTSEVAQVTVNSSAAAVGSWLMTARNGDVVYFSYPARLRIERYDLATETWLTPLTFSEPPGFFTIVGGALYVSSGIKVSRFTLEGTGGITVLTTSSGYEVTSLSAANGLLFVSDRSDGITTVRLADLSKLAVSLYGQGFSGPILANSSATMIYGRYWPPSFGRAVAANVKADGSVSQVNFAEELQQLSCGDRFFFSPGERYLLNETGVVLEPAKGAYVANLGGFDDVDFTSAGNFVVLRDGAVHLYDAQLNETGSFPAGIDAARLFLRGNEAHLFARPDATGVVRHARLPLAQARPRDTAVALDAAGLAFTPDETTIDRDGVVLLLSKLRRQVFRWSTTERRFLASIPLSGFPNNVAYLESAHRLYLAYPDGRLTQVKLDGGSLAEEPFATLLDRPDILVPTGKFVFAQSRSYDSNDIPFWYLFSSDGKITVASSGDHFRDATWSPATRRLYYFQDNSTSGYLSSLAIGDDRTFAGTRELNLSTYFPGARYPIRISTSGSRLLRASGQLFGGSPLQATGTVLEPYDDALWLGETPVTARVTSRGIEVKRWSAGAYVIERNAVVAGRLMRLLPLAGDRLLVVSVVDGLPTFTVFDSALNVLSRDNGGTPNRIANLSTRASVGRGDQILIPGFVISGAEPKSLLIRATGPALANFGVPGPLADPIMTIYDAAGGIVATNDTWSIGATSTFVAGVGARVGAFPLVRGSRDAAVYTTLPPGAYTVQVKGVGDTTGVGLVEVGSSRVDLQACKLEYSIVSPK